MKTAEDVLFGPGGYPSKRGTGEGYELLRLMREYGSQTLVGPIAGGHTAEYFSQVHVGDPPKMYKRPRCPWCKRPRLVKVLIFSPMKRAYQYLGAGHFCSNKHAAAWVNEQIDRQK